MRLSVRAETVPASAIRRMFNLARGMDGVIDLSIGAPDFTTPVPIAEAGVSAIRAGCHSYSPNAGLPVLREAIAAKLERENGVRYDPDTEICVTVGATEALGLLMMTLLDPGDEVILPEPAWPNYLTQIHMAGGVPVAVPTLEADGFCPRPSVVEAAVTDRTRAMLLNSPNNPTGAVTGPDTVRALAEIASRHGLWLISDEVYERIIYDGRPHISPAALPGMRDRVVTVNSFSKSYAMCGWRVGYAAAPARLIASLVKLQEGMASCAGSMAQVAAAAALNGSQEEAAAMQARYQVRRDLVVDRINRIPGLSALNPGGSFYLFVNVQRLGEPSSAVAMALLQEARVMTVPGSGFGRAGEGYLRLCFARDEGILKDAMDRVGEVVAGRQRQSAWPGFGHAGPVGGAEA